MNVFQRFIKSLHQQTKPHGLVGQFTNIQNGNKESYDSIDAFLHQLKEVIGDPIATIYVIDITGMTTIGDDDKKFFLPDHTSNHQ